LSQIIKRFTPKTKGKIFAHPGLSFIQAAEMSEKELEESLDESLHDTAVRLKDEGNASYRQGNFEEAVRSYALALHADPNYEDAIHNKGLALLKLGRIDEAKQCSDKLNELRSSEIVQPAVTNPAGIVMASPIPMTRFCPTCGTSLPIGNPKNCPACGANLGMPGKLMTAEMKNPGIAALCSFVIPGLGQVYNGEVGKAVAVLIGTLVGALFFIVPGAAIWVFGMYDAYRTAGKMNRGEVPYRMTSTVGIIAYCIAALALMFVFLIIGLLILALSILGGVGNSGGIGGLNGFLNPGGPGTPSGIFSQNGTIDPNGFLNGYNYLFSLIA
jgi:tetratricopeptide (TPR) repeat protein